MKTITGAQWRAVLEPNKCSMEDFGAGHQAGLVRMCGLDEACRTPAGEAALARLREIAMRRNRDPG